jgi:2-polyprenyl-6-methoxyphenol hydroxylase-like FAD-dependent oxidoreductase
MPRLPVKEQMAFWKKRFADAGWIAPQLAKDMTKSEYFYCSESIQVKPSTFSSSRVVLLGDAASCPGPTGMGTTNALVGAYILAGQIARMPQQASASDIQHAFDGYENIMRPFTEQLQKVWPGVFRFVMPDSSFGVWLLRFVAKWVARLRIPSLASTFGREDDGKGAWEVPIYEELERQTYK